MSDGQFGPVLRQLRLLAGRPDDEPNDRHLLECFARRRDEGAFTILVQRHGPMVFGVCRRMLRHRQDAEDAFQGTFLVLARKAGVLAWRDGVGPWLHEVATRVAMKVRSGVARRVRVERDGESADRPVRDRELADDLRAVLDEELSRLPAKYRSPLVLCYLQGKTNVEAARELGWTKGTVSGRLARARDLLRGRLTRRGVTLGAALAASLAREAASATVPVAWLRSAVGCGTGREVSAAALALADAAARPTGIRAGVIAAALLILAGSGLGLAWFALPPVPTPTPPVAGEPTRPVPVAAGWRELSAVKVEDFAGGLCSLAVSPDGRTVAAVLARGEVKLFRADDGVLTGTLTTVGGFAVGVAFSPDGKSLAVASDDDVVRVVDAVTLKEAVRILTPVSASGRVVFSPDGGTLAVIAGDNQGVRLFATDTGRPRGGPAGLAPGVSDVAFSADGKRLIFTGGGGLGVWDLKAGRLVQTVTPGPVPNFEDVEVPLAVSADGSVLLTTRPHLTRGGRLRTWDVQTGRPLADVITANPVVGAKLSPDGSTLAVCVGDGAVTLHDAAAGKSVANLGKVEPGVGLPMAFGGGHTFAAGTYELKVWRFHND